MPRNDRANHPTISPRYRRGKSPRFYFADGRRHTPEGKHTFRGVTDRCTRCGWPMDAEEHQ